MAINFSNINLEIVDINTNATPDLYVNQAGTTFSKRVLEDLNYPQFVQFSTDPAQHVFAIRACKGNEKKAFPFAKPRGEQPDTLKISNKNLHGILTVLIPNYTPKTRYKIIGELDVEKRIMYFDMATAQESAYRAEKE